MSNSSSAFEKSESDKPEVSFVTESDLEEFAESFEKVVMAEKKLEKKVSFDLPAPKESVASASAAQNQEQTAITVIPPDDIDSRIDTVTQRTPIPKAQSKPLKEIPNMMTEDEENALKRYRKNVKDISLRESVIFLHGYRSKGDYERRHMEALLRSLNQTTQVMATHGRNVRHITNNLNEGVQESRKRVTQASEAPPAKSQKTLMNHQIQAINTLLELDNTDYAKMYDKYDLSVTHMYDALKDIMDAMEKGDYSMMEPPNKWPDVIYERLAKKVLSLKKSALSLSSK
ncbi:TPA_asm: protein 2 [Holcus virus 1]|uniref:Protein 2 n=1 Tax=Holcus virus 1 TaxID=2984270 RepID=A0A9N6YJE6_9RHAB|nr:TPA_asm: protein 2 [Holcus virus 1]